uniref:Uncharacterized protein n=1 Tax=Anguilla anguilla TaxID=7936 RepID=A0A0E9RUY2_ANGAN
MPTTWLAHLTDGIFRQMTSYKSFTI